MFENAIEITNERRNELKQFEDTVGTYFNEIHWLNLAFTHKSYIKREKEYNNQRLEFLGDSVLSIFMSQYLFNYFIHLNEGSLTKIKNQLVSEPLLAELAITLDLGKYLLLGVGEEKNNGRKKASLLADTFEAVLGAIFQDKGIQVVFSLLEKLYKEKISHYSIGEEAILDYKSKFQVMVQKKIKICPHYEILEEKGGAHSKTFTVGLYVGKKLLTQGSEKSRRMAEQIAAKKALEGIEKGEITIL